MKRLSRTSRMISACALALLAACGGQNAGPSEADGANTGAAASAVAAVAKGKVDVEGGLVSVAAPRDGVITEVFVEEGAQVKAGDLLARQDDRVARAALAEAIAARTSLRGRVESIRAQIANARDEASRLSRNGSGSAARARIALLRDQLAAARREFARQSGQGSPDPNRARIAGLEVQLRAAEREENRLSSLSEAGAESRQSLDRARDERQRIQAEISGLRAEADRSLSQTGDQVRTLEREIAVAEAELSRSGVDASSRVRQLEAELSAATGDLEAAGARVVTAQLEVEQRLIRAPLDGVVVRQAARPGVGASTLNVTSLFTIAPLTAKIVRAEVEESMVGAVRAGQRVSIVIEGLERGPTTGTVVRVGQVFGAARRDNDPDAKADQRVVEVVTSLDDQSLIIGQRVRVTFAAGAVR